MLENLLEPPKKLGIEIMVRYVCVLGWLAAVFGTNSMSNAAITE